MKKVRDNSAPPPGGNRRWVYVCAETGFRLEHAYFNVLKRMVLDHFKANNLPIGLLFDEQFEENLCANAGEAACVEFTPPSILEKMSTFGRALAGLAKNIRRPLVDEDELKRRRSICEQCNYFGGSTSPLKVACKRCGCSSLKAYLVNSTCPLTPPKW